jgi:uncharacterized protein
MKVLIDVNHPAHVHFFRVPAQQLLAAGHEVVFTSRDKDVTQTLLEEIGIKHLCLSSMGGGVWGLLRELIFRNLALWRVVRQERPDVMLAIGGTFVAHVSIVSRVSALVFYDTENARLQNLITYPFADCVIVPNCYQAWLPRRHRRYQGYHELSYLAPDYFKPDRAKAEAAGLAPTGDTFLLRVVSWQANHDIGETGWSQDLLRQLIDFLQPRGRVLIASELELPDEFTRFLYRGPVSDLHHLMAHCRLLVAESATMASECAVLGVPAIYAAHTGRGYTDEQERRYGLVRNVTELKAASMLAVVADILARDAEHYRTQARRLLAESVDVAGLVVDTAEEFGGAA